MSTAVATASPPRVLQARHAGWAGIALGFVAWFITLPPALLRTPVPSILIGLLAMTAGAWAIGGDEKRLGWGAIVAGLVGGAGAVAATRSGTGNLEDVVAWSALIAATLLTGCSVFKGHGDKGPKTAVLGERIPVLTVESSAGTDASISATQVLVPPADTTRSANATSDCASTARSGTISPPARSSSSRCASVRGSTTVWVPRSRSSICANRSFSKRW